MLLVQHEADRLGQDLFSHKIYGSCSLKAIGLHGVAASFVLRIFLEGLSSYIGGVADNNIKHSMEFLRSTPSIPLWTRPSAALPDDCVPIRRYFAITVILMPADSTKPIDRMEILNLCWR